MSARLGHAVGPPDDAARVDDERHPGRVPAVLAFDAEGGAGLAGQVREQAERELVVGREGTVLVDAVEGSAEYVDAERFELTCLVAEPAPLDRSTARGRLGVPPDDEPAPGEVVERDPAPVMRGQVEAGSGRAGFEHDG